MRRLTCIAIFLLCALYSSAGTQGANGLRGVAVSPVMFRTLAKAGQTLNLQISVENLEPAAIGARLNVRSVVYADWTYSPLLDKSHPRDCSTWFSVREQQRSIAANTLDPINLKVVVPRGASGPYWCLVTLDPAFRSGTSIQTQYQIPIILLVGTQPKPDLQLQTPVLTVNRESAGTVEVPFENNGDGFTVIGSSIQLRDSRTGRLIGQAEDFDRNLYPRSKRSLKFFVGRLPDGQYQVSARTQAGMRVFRSLTRTFAVKKGKVEPVTAGSTVGLAPFVIQPDKFRFQLPRGAEKSVALRIENSSRLPSRVELTPKNLMQTSVGGFILGDASYKGPLKISISPNVLSLAPRQAANVRVTVSVPQTAQGDLWFAVAAQQAGGTSMAEEVYGSVVVPKTASPNLVLRKGKLDVLRGVPISLAYEIENTGNTALMPLATARVLEQGLTPVADVDIPKLGDGGILPGTVLRNKIMLPPGLKPGSYAISIVYQYGESSFARLSVPVTVAKPAVKKGK